MNSTWILHTYGNQAIIYNILMSMGAFFGGGVVLSLVKLAAITTILMFLFNAIGITTKGEINRPIDLMFFIRFYLLYSILVLIPAGMPGKIVIEDTMYGTPQVVTTSSSNVIPFGAIMLNSYISRLFYGLINVYEQYFETGASGNPSLGYTKSGMAFGSNFIAAMPTFTTGDVTFEQNLSNYFSNCGLPLVSSQGAMLPFTNATDIMSFFASNFQDIQQNRFVTQTDTLGNQTVTDCLSAIGALNKTWATNISQYQQYAANLVGFPGLATQAFISASDATASSLLNITDGATALKQAIAMNIVYKSLYSLSSQTGNSSLANAVYDAQQFQQYKTGGELSGEQAARIVPALVNFADALLFMMYPLMVFYALMASSFAPVIKYIKFCATINAIPLVYEILNSVIFWYASSVTNPISSSNGLSILNATNLYSLNANIVAVANYLSMATPIIAYALVSGSDMAITSLFSHSTDPGRQTSASAATDMAHGNLNMGNTNVDNTSFSNTQANKFNPVFDMTTGSSSMNNISPLGMTSNIGGLEYEQAFKTTKTSMPVDINYAQIASQQLSNSLNHSHAIAGSYSTQWSQTRDNLHQLQSSLSGSHTTQTGTDTQLSKDLSRAEQLSTKVQAGLSAMGSGANMSLNETSNMQNDLKQLQSLSDKYSVSHKSDISNAFKQVSDLANRSGKVVSDTLNTIETINKINSSQYGVTAKMAGDFQQYLHKNGMYSNNMTTEALDTAAQTFTKDYLNHSFGVNTANFTAKAPDLQKSITTIDKDASHNEQSVTNISDGGIIARATQYTEQANSAIDGKVNNELDSYSPINEVGNQVLETGKVVGSVAGDLVSDSNNDNPDQVITDKLAEYVKDKK